VGKGFLMLFLSWENEFPFRRPPLAKPRTTSDHFLRRGTPALLIVIAQFVVKVKDG
jgi:hypothetical protein